MDMVKLLHVTDIHGSRRALKEIMRLYPAVDLIVISGDVANYFDLHFFYEFFEEICKVDKKVLYVLGNNEPRDLEAPHPCVKLDGRKEEALGLIFGGLGGSPYTPYNTPNEYSEEEAENVLNGLGKVDILISHAPPYGTRADKGYKGHFGSKAVLSYVLKYRPRLVLSGHVHEAHYAGWLNGTLIINPGMTREGHYAVVNVGGDITYELVNFNE
jgi:hypothetical protein